MLTLTKARRFVCHACGLLTKALAVEVAGQAEGVTLLEAIEGGDVPYPERMSYVAWLKWRRKTGSRPLSKRDGVSTTPEQEAALWRKVMKFLHNAEGEDEEEEEEEEDSELVPEVSGAGGDSPPRVDVSAAARELAMVPTGAAYVPATAPGSRPAGPSGPPSTAGSVSGTAEGLQAELRAIFRPNQEPVADYLTRVSLVLALKAHGVTVTPVDVVLFYEEFEDVCALANNCHGMSAREKLLARGRCRGSRMKTYTNVDRAAWKSGEVLSDPQAVYDRIKNKHLMFKESREKEKSAWMVSMPPHQGQAYRPPIRAFI